MRFHKKPPSGKNTPALAPTPPAASPACERGFGNYLNGIGDRRFWLSARALVFENSGPCSKEPLAIRDMRRVVNGERRSRTSCKVLTGAFVP